MTVEQLAGLAKVAQDLGASAVKCSTRQTLLVLINGDKVEQLLEAIKELGLQEVPFGSTVRNVKACAGGAGLCPRQLGDALALGIKIEKNYLGQQTPKDFKISTAGCPRGCTEPYCADFGAVATGKDMFNIIIGGRGSTGNPVHGTVIAKKVHADKVCAVLDYVLEKYRQLGQPHERLSSTIKRVGLEQFIPPQEIYQSDAAGVDEEFANFLLSED